MTLARTLGIALACGLISTALPAQALTIFNEVEPNNTRTTAQFLNTLDTSIQVNGSRRNTNVAVARSADWYRFDVGGPSYLSLSIASVGQNASSAQIIYGLYDSSGTLLSFGGGPSTTSVSNSLSVTGAGSYYLAIVGYSGGNLSNLFTGNFTAAGINSSSYNWDYKANINYTTVPEPSEWAVIGLSVMGVGGLMFRARRKTLSSLA
ncbi:MAG: hypothetical protein QM758_03975 [Armatimonas sp.]